jgi:hypothetical protein
LTTTSSAFTETYLLDLVQQVTRVETVHEPEIGIDLTCAHLKLDSSQLIVLIDQPAVPEDLVLKDNGSRVQNDHVHLRIGELLQLAHQLEAAVERRRRVIIVKQNGDIYIGTGSGPPLGLGAEQVGGNDVRLGCQEREQASLVQHGRLGLFRHYAGA